VNRKNRQTGLRWRLILFLAALGLLRPLLSVAGAYDAPGGGPLGPLVVTAVVATFWVGVVVIARATNPILTLVFVGGLYGAFAILLQQVGWRLFLGGPPAEAPSSVPILVISWTSILVTNAVWGVFLGLIATGLHRLLPRHGVEV
jgi:hypothetical protein